MKGYKMKFRNRFTRYERDFAARDAHWLRACKYPNNIVRLMVVARYGWDWYWRAEAYKLLGKKYQYHFNNWR